MSTEYDFIVIGAGVAGGVFAASQDSSKKILVIERDLTEPDRIVGELMQPGGVETLKELNLSHLLEGIDAQPVVGYKLLNGERTFKIDYKDVNQELCGIGLRNGKFLTNIREDLRKRENVTLLEGNVTRLVQENDRIVGVGYTENGEEKTARAALTVVSDGPMSLLRNQLSNVNKEVSSYFIGTELKNVNTENASYGHMIVGGESPILIYAIDSNTYRILIDYPKAPRVGEKLKAELMESVVPHLPEYFVQAFKDAIETEELLNMPNHAMKAQAYRKHGAVLLGDSLNMRHPLTGGGMTACFIDIQHLTQVLTDVELASEEQVNKALKAYYEDRVNRVGTINILANALYKVFKDDELKEACFNYLERGGERSKGPLSILAGINRDKKNLLKHFFRVALQRPENFILKPKKQWYIFKTAKGIIGPILKTEELPAYITENGKN